MAESLLSAEEAAAAATDDVRSFHIDVYSRADHYRCRILLLGSDLRQTFTGFDLSAIGNFISRYLPPLPKRSGDAGLFKAIDLVQAGRTGAQGEPLKAWKPFRVRVLSNLPVVAESPDFLNECDAAYSVQAWIWNLAREKIMDNNAEGRSSRPRGAVNEVSVGMNGLPPGRYSMEVQLVFPAGRAVENTRISFCVEI
jgi:hypothetical protein